MTGAGHGPDEVLLAFTRALRAAGVAVTHDRAAGFLAAAAIVGLGDPRATYRAGRATLCSSPDDLVRYDQVFEAFFDPRTGLPRERRSQREDPPVVAELALDDGDGADADGDEEVVKALASDLEVLRHRDVADLSAVERFRLARLFARLRPRPPMRRTIRDERFRRGRVDAAATIRASLRLHGEPAPIHWRQRRLRPRRVVLLIDVSGSMSGYADALLRLAHTLTRSYAAQGGRTETFTVGTRLTHLTRAMRVRDVERALVAAGDAVPDWSGGTRLGETLGVFIDRWGRRGLARGAVVVIFSDGWERGDPALLGEQARRLARIAHRVVWVNPHRGKAGYAPVQQGIRAVLPHIDDLLAGHTMATYEELTEVLSRA
ncbi:vWA domain-containing protein [Nocardioides sp. GXZ039]|uniref:vWA domain-containing protein n=1 Tax=Nocardioides sp. GXZ039 TaxID=3136018 RepID=UPI0030F3960E